MGRDVNGDVSGTRADGPTLHPCTNRPISGQAPSLSVTHQAVKAEVLRIGASVGADTSLSHSLCSSVV